MTKIGCQEPTMQASADGAAVRSAGASLRQSIGLA
jgi:hypothetical protein